MKDGERSQGRSLTRIWLLGAWAINLPWEILQRPLYAGYQGFGAHVKDCVIASLGDVVILAALFAFMAAAAGSWSWFDGSRARFAAIAMAGAAVATAIEYRALYLGKWSYAESMPLIPVLNVGASPVVQMVLGPVALAFWSRRGARRSRGHPRAKGEER